MMKMLTNILFVGLEWSKTFPPFAVQRAAGRSRPSTVPALQLLATLFLTALISGLSSPAAEIQQFSVSQAGGNTVVNVLLLNNDIGATYETAELKIGVLLRPVAETVQLRNPAYADKTIDEIIHGWAGGVNQGEVYNGWNITMNNGVAELTHGPFGYTQWSDNPSQDAMSISFNLWDQLDFNGNGLFDPDSEALVQTTNVVEEAFDARHGINIYLADGYAYSVIAETTNGTPYFWLDDYELTTDTTDPDNDGFQTLEEYITGTNPTNSASFFHIDIEENGITFASASNRLYAVEACSVLGDHAPPSNHWNNVTNNLPGTGNILTVPFDTNRFYRVKVSLP